MYIRILIIIFIFCSINFSNAGEPCKAYDFVQSIGVNTHFGYYDTQYNSYDDLLRPYLIESGIKHIRDGTYDNKVLHKYHEIGEKGICLLLISDAESAVEKVKSIGSMLWGIEAVNEPDRRKKTGTWEEDARKQQKKLYENIKNDSTTKHIPVLGVSLANVRESPVSLGDISQWMDYGNIHPYAAGQHPAKHWGWGLDMEEAIKVASNVSREKPLIVTECGYHNKIENPGHPGVPEDVAAIYHLHLPFVYFKQGITRSYKYEFIDLKPDPAMTDMECHFGLIRADGTPKPSYHALKNLITLLDDKEDDFTLQTLAFDIKVPEGENVQTLLLQKTDGTRWLALYRIVSIYDPIKMQKIPVNPIDVNMSFKEKSYKVTLYIPNISVQPQDKQEGKTYSYSLGAEPALLKIEDL